MTIPSNLNLKEEIIKDREISYGKIFPLEIRTGISEDNKTSYFYILYA